MSSSARLCANLLWIEKWILQGRHARRAPEIGGNLRLQRDGCSLRSVWREATKSSPLTPTSWTRGLRGSHLHLQQSLKVGAGFPSTHSSNATSPAKMSAALPGRATCFLLGAPRAQPSACSSLATSPSPAEELAASFWHGRQAQEGTEWAVGESPQWGSTMHLQGEVSFWEKEE